MKGLTSCPSSIHPKSQKLHKPLLRPIPTKNGVKKMHYQKPHPRNIKNSLQLSNEAEQILSDRARLHGDEQTTTTSTSDTYILPYLTHGPDRHGYGELLQVLVTPTKRDNKFRRAPTCSRGEIINVKGEISTIWHDRRMRNGSLSADSNNIGEVVDMVKSVKHDPYRYRDELEADKADAKGEANANTIGTELSIAFAGPIGVSISVKINRVSVPLGQYSQVRSVALVISPQG